MEPILSLCVIARDAAVTLEDCLASVEQAVDEIVVVDTGSSDATPAVARCRGARVYFLPWPDDFAAVRNFALGQARGDWVLFLDADEVLYPGDGATLRRLLEDPGVEAYFLPVHSLVDCKSRELVSPALRLFRRRPEYYWQGRVHEQILPSIMAARRGRVEIAPVRVRHYGYLPEEVAKYGKIERNIRLLKLELAERPEDPFVLFNLGVEEMRSGRPAEALRHFDKAKEKLSARVSFAHLLERRRIDCLVALGRLSEAISAARAAQRNFPLYTDLIYQEGVVLVLQGKVLEAEYAFRRCLEQGDAPVWFTGEKGAGGWRARLALARVLVQRGQKEAAAGCYVDLLRRGEGGEEEAAEELLGLVRQGRGEPWAERGWAALAEYHLQSVAALAEEAENYMWGFRGRPGGKSVAEISVGEAGNWPGFARFRNLRRVLTGPRPTLSLCVIVKDEAETLARCLASTAGAVDEIVVVDTGSKDASPDIARQAGARIYFLPWPDDFAAVRNFALEKASGDWVLVLDADEEIRREDIPSLRRLLWRQDVEAYCLRVVNYYGPVAGADFVTDNVCRLFRRRPEYKFRGRLHEQVVDSIREAAGPESIKFTGITVYHYGYLDSCVKRKDKSRRNRFLLSLALAEDPANPYWQYALAVEEFHEGRYSEALERLSGIEIDPRTGYASDLAYKRVVCLMELGRYEEALSFTEVAVNTFPGFTDLVFLKAEILAGQARWEEAAASYSRCLEQGDASPRYSGVNGVGTFRAWLGLAVALDHLGKADEAVKALRRAWDSRPGWPQPLYVLARILCSSKGEEEAAAELERRLMPVKALDYLRLADILASAGAYGLALEYLALARERGERSRRLVALERLCREKVVPVKRIE